MYWHFSFSCVDGDNNLMQDMQVYRHQLYSEVKVSQSCPTLCDPMDYTVHEILQARILESVAFPFSRGIFPTQGSNPGLPHCRWVLYQLSHKGSPVLVDVSPNALSLFQNPVQESHILCSCCVSWISKLQIFWGILVVSILSKEWGKVIWYEKDPHSKFHWD